MNTNYASMSEEELREAEREIARRHMNKFPIWTVTWGLANVVCWLSLWPLVLMGTVPVWLGFIIAMFNFLLFYLPSHEAQHSIIARPGEKLRWFNEFVGQVCSMPLVIPYRVLRKTHMEHHKFANDPELDPDYDLHADTAWGAIWAGIQRSQPKPSGKQSSYSVALQRLDFPELLLEAGIYQLAHYAIMFSVAWSGYAIEAALLWWLPRPFSGCGPKLIVPTFLSFLLEHPATRKCGSKNCQLERR